jgi:prevent-host-death family protein
MTTINVTNARKQLYTIIEDVNSSHNPIHITSKKGSAVLISEEDWSSIEETLHLSSIPGMAESIKKGLAEPIDKCVNTLDW